MSGKRHAPGTSFLADRLRALGDERGVFIPGLIGAGILLSIVMLAADALRKLLPVDGARGRAARTLEGSVGRAEDLAAVARGEPPLPARVARVPRPRLQAALLGTASLGAGAGVVVGTVSLYRAEVGVLADRGWTLGAGYSAALLLALTGGIWILSALLAQRRPDWLVGLATWGPMGVLPDVEDGSRVLTRPRTSKTFVGARHRTLSDRRSGNGSNGPHERAQEDAG